MKVELGSEELFVNIGQELSIKSNSHVKSYVIKEPFSKYTPRSSLFLN